MRHPFSIEVAHAGQRPGRTAGHPDHPEIAILDWLMPGIDGIDLCKRIRREPDLKDTYIIILSAKSKKTDIYLGIHAGASDYASNRSQD